MFTIVIKKCVICGTEFDARGRDLTCSEGCSSKSKDIYYSNYRLVYYRENMDKWKMYHANELRDAWGTGGLGERATRDKKGDIDFKVEEIKINKELRSLRLR